MNSRRFEHLFFEHDGKLTDKWEQYLHVYENELKRFVSRGAPVRLLEIGVQNGGSLEIWAKYLPPDSSITGIDIDPAVQDLRFAGNIQVLVADINDTEKVLQLIGPDPFDIIIDDGSHTSSDIRAAFDTLFPRLAPGGKYIVEDLHASYWSSHEGGLRLRSSSVEYIKDMVDALNADHFRPEDPFSPTEKLELQKLGKQIGRITFYDSVAVIDKLTREKDGPYRHLVCGQYAMVNSPVNFIITAPTEVVEPWLLGDTAARSIDLALKDDLAKLQLEMVPLGITAQSDREAALRAAAEVEQDRHSELDSLSRQSEQLQARLDKAVADLDEARRELSRTGAELEDIRNSAAQRAVATLQRMMSKVWKP